MLERVGDADVLERIILVALVDAKDIVDQLTSK